MFVYVCLDATKAECRRINNQVRAVLNLLPWKTRQRDERQRHAVKLEWQTRVLRAIPLKSIVCAPELRALLPARYKDELFDDLVVCRRLVRPIGTTIFNFSSVSKRLPALPQPNEQCVCRQIFAAQYRPGGGCVRTGDLSIVRREDVRRLLELGPRFRTVAPTQPDTLQAVKDALEGFVARYVEPQYVSQFRAWKVEVLNRCRSRLEPVKLSNQTRDKGVVMKADMRRHLQWLHRYLPRIRLPTTSSSSVWRLTFTSFGLSSATRYMSAWRWRAV